MCRRVLGQASSALSGPQARPVSWKRGGGIAKFGKYWQYRAWRKNFEFSREKKQRLRNCDTYVS